MDSDGDRTRESSSPEGRCPRCGEMLRAVHTLSRYQSPTVALLECARCRYTCQTVVPGLWPDEAFPRTHSSAR
jgi:transcription elongation factor Elf1